MYVRWSSDNQDGQSSIAGQKEAMKKFAEEHGIEIVGVITGEGGVGENEYGNASPALTRLLTAAQSPESLFDKVLVYSWSRLTRSAHEARVLKSLLSRHGVKVVSVTEPGGPPPTERLIDVLFTIFEAWQRECHSEATRRGIAAARRRRQCS